MREFRLRPNAALMLFAIVVMLLVTAQSEAGITTSPSTAIVAPGLSTPTITAILTFPPGPSVVNAAFTGLPPGSAVVPDPVVILIGIGDSSAAASFEIFTSSSTPPGTYPIFITTSPDIGAGVGTFTLVVAVPDFQTSLSPNPLSIAWGTTAQARVSTVALFEFSNPISYRITGLPPGITTGAPQAVSAPYPPIDIPVSVAPRTPPGVYSASLVATWTAIGPQSRSIPVSIIVQPPTLAAAFSPASITVATGGATSGSAFVLTPGNGYAGSPVLAWGALPSGIELSPPTLSAPALPPVQSISVSVRASSAPPGTYTITARAIDTLATIDTTASLIVTVLPPADATISVVPSALSVRAGQSASVSLTATGVNGFDGALDVVAPVVPGVAFSPQSFSLRAGESRQVTVRPSPTATTGTFVATFSAASAALNGTRTAVFALTVTPPAPEITSVTPPALTAGSKGMELHLTGLHFLPGATVAFRPPGPIVTRSLVVSSTLVNLLVDTPAATPVGQYAIDLRNPDGATSAGPPLLVMPSSTLGAPLSVPTAAIVFPRPYAAVTLSEPIFPRAILATTGAGTIIGTWRFDGVPFDQFVVAVSGGYPVEVEAKMPIPVATNGEHRLELVVEQPQQLATEPVPVIVSIETNSGLRILEPAAGEAVSRSETLFRWTIVPGASGYEIELARDDDRPFRTIRLSDSRWRPDDRSLASIGTGKARFRVAAVFPGEVRGRPTPWRAFVIPEDRASASLLRAPRAGSTRSPVRLVRYRSPESQPLEPAATMEAEVQSDATELPRDWALTLLGSASETDEDVPSILDAARIQLTTAGDLQDASYLTKWTGDLSGRKDLDPQYDTEGENGAWQIELGALQARSREEIRAGYSPPDFLDQSEFLAAGLARGGVLGRVATPFGSVSLYDTIDDSAAGAVSAYELTQRISAAAWEAPGDTNRSLFRLFGMRARGDATSDHPETEAEAIGVLWRFMPSQAITLVVEGAQGTLDGMTQSNGEAYDGYGVRVGASGARGTFSWGINLGDVDADFVNPANLGLSVGGVPDRTGGDLTLGKSLGTTMLSLQLRSQRSGTLADGSGETIAENSWSFTLVAPMSAKFVASATAAATATEGDGNLDYQLPATDRTMLSLGVTLSETFGAMFLAESIAWQELTDDVTSAFDSTVTSGSVTAGGMLGSTVLLSALLSSTRSESPEPVGTTDLWLASLQPTFNWSSAALALTPRVSYTRVESELGGTSECEQYGLVVQWSPPWWQSFLNAQIGADWSRNLTEGLPTPDFDQRIVASLTLRWGLSRAILASAPPAPLPPPPAAAANRARTRDAQAR